MANGKIRFGKHSGGELALVIPDGVSNTEVTFPASGVLATEQYVDGKYSGFKNYIINGKKVINQRGLTSTNNSYNQDRWYKAGNNWFQGIEGANNLISGKTYTLSWVGGATASYYVGNATSSTINSQTFIPITNGGSLTLTISAGQNLWIKFESDATGSTFNFVQLEEGLVATPFENRPYGLEFSLCQRYYQKLDNSLTCFTLLMVTFSTTFVGNSFPVRSIIALPVVMRVSPSITYTSLSHGFIGGTPDITASSSTCSVGLNSTITGFNNPYVYFADVALSAEL